MRILILGAGKMGSFFTDVLSFQHETAVFDVAPKRLRFRLQTPTDIPHSKRLKEFKPELVINAATVKYTLDAFHPHCPLSQGLHHQRYCLGKDGLKRV